jgi:hypothetical protein
MEWTVEPPRQWEMNPKCTAPPSYERDVDHAPWRSGSHRQIRRPTRLDRFRAAMLVIFLTAIRGNGVEVAPHSPALRPRECLVPNIWSE